MNTDKNILIAFILNLSFSIFELIGGYFTNSVAIMSDALHDFGDALSIGLSLILEKISKKKADNKYTFGYKRYSILGAYITTTILFLGSLIVIYNAIKRILNPEPINYDGMIIFAVFGVIVNFLAAYFTRGGDSMNQKAVNLHMLEDVLGWAVVLVGSVLMKFTDISYIDSIMSIGIAIFILINAYKGLKEILDIFLLKMPESLKVHDIEKMVLAVPQVEGVHHVHVWSMDGQRSYGTMHLITSSKDSEGLKKTVKEKLKDLGLVHTTIEIEGIDENCEEIHCQEDQEELDHSHHHHHHHH